MNRQKRKEILRILNSGVSASNKGFQIGQLLNQPEEDIIRIMNNSKWNHPIIMGRFNYFSESKNHYRYTRYGVEVLEQ